MGKQMKYSNTFLAKADVIARLTQNPETVLQAMTRMMVQTIKKINAIYVRDLFKSLLKNKVGTAEVHALSLKLCKKLSTERAKTLVNIVMKWKLNDAYKILRRQTYEENMMWKSYRKLFIEENVIIKFNNIWDEERCRIRKDFRETCKQKVKWLKDKFKIRKEIPQTYEGIYIGDQETDDSFVVKPKLILIMMR